MNPRKGYCILLLAAITMVAYYPTLFAPFNLIDDKLLIDDLINREGFSWSRHLFPGGRGDYYRPLITLSYEFDKFAWGLEESFMHLENILLHALNTILMYLFARKLSEIYRLSTGWLPFLAAAMFALHPVNTEAVNWITARTDLFAAVGVYLSLYALLVFIHGGRLAWGVVSAAGLGLGALAKEPALFVFPGLILILWLCRRESGTDRTGPSVVSKLIVSVSIVATVAGYFLLRLIAFHSDRGIENTAKAVASVSVGNVAAETANLSVTELANVLLKSIGFYFKKMFWPFPLNFATVSVPDYCLFFGILVILLLCWLLYRRTLLACVGCASLFLASSALLVLLNPIAWTPVAERYLYIASGPFIVAGFLAVVRGLPAHFTGLRWAYLPAGLLLASSAYATISRNIIWQDNLALFRDTVEKSPRNDIVKNDLAIALIAAGHEEEGYSLLESLPGTKGQASSLNRVSVLFKNGQYAEARQFLLKQLENSGPLELDVLKLLIKSNMHLIEAAPDDKSQLRRYYLEIVDWLERLHKRTGNPFYWYRLGQVYLAMKEPAQAQLYFARAAEAMAETSPYRKPAAKLAKDLLRQ